MNNVSLKFKIIGMSLLILCFNILVCIYGLYQINLIGKDLDTIVSKNNKLTESITNLSSKHYKQALDFNRSYYAGIAGDNFSFTTFQRLFIRSRNLINSDIENTVKVIKEASKSAGSSEKEQFRKFQKMIKDLKSLNDNYTLKAQKVLYYLEKGQKETAETFKTDIQSTEVVLAQEIDKDLIIVKKFIKKTTQKAQARKDLSMILMSVFSIVSIIVGLTLTFILTGVIGRSVKGILDYSEKLSMGDYTETMDVKNHDEIGTISNSLNHMSQSNRTVFAGIRGNSETLKEASAKMSDHANGIFREIEDLSGNTQSVTTSVADLTLNMNYVSRAMEKASTNVETVAAAAEQMNTTVNEIAGNSEKARKISESAVLKSNDISAIVDQLGKAAMAISGVTDTITKISEQTNLLALNATIEAARAGEAGRGFAVVANEIKELANQTANSTQEIQKRIQEIQISTNETVGGIAEISKIIKNVNEYTSGIATSVEEQSISTREIAQNASNAFSGINDVSKNISESTNAVNLISNDILKINNACRDIAFSSMEVNLHSKELDKISVIINEKIENFNIGERKFNLGAVKIQYLSKTMMFEALRYPEMNIDLSDYYQKEDSSLGEALSQNGTEFNGSAAYKKFCENHEKLQELTDHLIEMSENEDLTNATEYLDRLSSARVEMFKWLDELYSEQ